MKIEANLTHPNMNANMNAIWKAHCKDRWPREFAYKPLPGESPLNLVRVRPVSSLDALIRLVDTFSNRPGLYVSVYAYTHCAPKCLYETAIIDRIYLDFDSKDNLELAISEANATIEALQDRGIETIPYFSGQKGIACYIDFPPTDIAPENKKQILGLFWDITSEGLDLELHTLDGGSIRGDIARVSRLPNTRHQSGLHCIPLEKPDLQRGATHIHSLARSQRTDIDLEALINENTRTNSAAIPRLLKNLESLVTERRKEAEDERMRKMQAQAEPTRSLPGSRFVTEDEVGRAKLYPISEILGNKKLVLCPFHKDTVPSLSIDHKKNLWHCFGCGRSGNVIQLVMELEGVDFPMAVRKLVSANI